MLKNYLLTAWRHLFKQRGYALINLAGLAVGFASFIVIALYVRYELSFDHYHDNADRIYRVSSELHAANGLEASRSASQGGPFAPLFAGDFPQVEKVGRILDCGGSQFGSMLVNGDVGYFDLDFAMADNEIFEIFDFEWLYGDRSAALTAPGTIVLTESAAIKYFGRTDAVGETLLQEGGYPVEVTGVIGDLPDNTHLNFGVIGSVLNQAPSIQSRSTTGACPVTTPMR